MRTCRHAPLAHASAGIFVDRRPRPKISQKFIVTAVTFLRLTTPIQHSDAECAGTSTRERAAVCFRGAHNKILESAMRKAVRSLLTVALGVTLMSAIRSKAQDDHSSSAVFVMTNAADRNEIISFRRAADGSLQQFRSFATGG